MRVSVITPSFNRSDWLKLCIASVADQGGHVEHLVQDGGSTDGTLDWLRDDTRVRLAVEQDRGMYDAINRGLRKAGGDVLAYLNCDEQYLPGTLEAVSRHLREHPEVDVLFADIVVVDGEGEYLCHRKVQVPRKYHTWLCHLSTLTCATFFRRRVVREMGVLFNPNLRADGDGQWVLELIRHKARMAVLRRFTSAYTQLGTNLGAQPEARREKEESIRQAPVWARAVKPAFLVQHWMRRGLDGAYRQAPFQYSIYTRQSENRRATFEVTRPTFRWNTGWRARRPA